MAHEDEHTNGGGLEIPEPIAREIYRVAPPRVEIHEVPVANGPHRVVLQDEGPVPPIAGSATAGMPRASGTVSNYVRHNDSQINMGPAVVPVRSGQLANQIQNGIHYDMIIFRETENGDEKSDEWEIYLGNRPMPGGLAIPPAHPWVYASCKWCGQPQGYPVMIVKNNKVQFEGCAVCMSWAAVGHR